MEKNLKLLTKILKKILNYDPRESSGKEKSLNQSKNLRKGQEVVGEETRQTITTE